MKRLLFIISLSLGLSLISMPGWASKAYITDSFRISLRKWPDTESEILRFLASGQPVEILESTDEWSRIELLDQDENNLIGWVLTRHLINRTPYEDQYRSLEKKNIQLVDDISNLKNELENAELREKALADEIKRYSGDLSKWQDMYENLKQESKEDIVLKSEHKEALEKIEKLIRENEALRKSQLQRWFALGALVLLVGLIIGHFVGKREKKLRSYY